MVVPKALWTSLSPEKLVKIDCWALPPIVSDSVGLQSGDPRFSFLGSLRGC